MNKKQKRTRNRIVLAIALFVVVYVVAELLPLSTWLGSETTALWVEFALFLVPYLIAGYDVLLRAAKNIGHGQVFDENFLMSVATIGAFALVLFPDSDPHMAEGRGRHAVLPGGRAVPKLRRGQVPQVHRRPDGHPRPTSPTWSGTASSCRWTPTRWPWATMIVVKPGERVPLDGVVVEGTSAAGHRRPHRRVACRARCAPATRSSAGCVNLTGLHHACASTKAFGESTVAKHPGPGGERQPRRRPRPRTSSPASPGTTPRRSCGIALCCWPCVPPLCRWARTGPTGSSAGLIFLVVSCPCALVICVPAVASSAASAAPRACGILVKGSNYLETLAGTETVVFDKTGTLTEGVVQRDRRAPRLRHRPASSCWSIAAHWPRAYSNHPIALSAQRGLLGARSTSSASTTCEEHRRPRRAGAQVDEQRGARGQRQAHERVRRGAATPAS